MADYGLEDDYRYDSGTGNNPIKPRPYAPTPPSNPMDWHVSSQNQTPYQQVVQAQQSNAPSGGGSVDDARRALEDLAKKYGATYEQGDAEKLIARAQGYEGYDFAKSLEDFRQQYERRGAPNQPSGGSQSRPASAFSDPVGGPVNDFANELFERLRNPPAGSGQNLLEDALRRLSQQFEGGGYTPAEMEQFQTQAIDPLERLRTARKQQVMVELSRRGLDPRSGVGQSMLADVDRQFDALRSQQQTQIGTQAAAETRARTLQALEMLSALAATEQGRLDKAFNYRTVPISLADRSFAQALQLYGQANPANLFNPAMQLAALGQSQQAGSQNALAQLAWLLLNG